MTGFDEHGRVTDATVTAFYNMQVGHAHLMQHLAAAHDLNPVDLRALKFLGAIDEDRTPKALAIFLARGSGAVTALLDRLAQRGLLERVGNPEDRRSVRITLTANGIALVGSLRAAYRDALQHSAPAGHIDLFIQLTNHVARAFRQTNAG